MAACPAQGPKCGVGSQQGPSEASAATVQNEGEGWAGLSNGVRARHERTWAATLDYLLL